MVRERLEHPHGAAVDEGHRLRIQDHGADVRIACLTANGRPSPTLAVAVGTAAGMAPATQLLFASLLFAALLVGLPGLDAIPAAVFAAATALLTRTALDRRLGP
jgi:hypothetical protein